MVQHMVHIKERPCRGRNPYYFTRWSVSLFQIRRHVCLELYLSVAIGCCFIMDWTRAIVVVTFLKLIGLLLFFVFLLSCTQY